MATYYGTAGGGGRQPWVIVTLQSRSSTSATVRFQVGSDAIQSTWGTFSGTLKVNTTSYAISGTVPSGSSGTLRDFTVTYNQGSAFSLAVSLTGSIPGTSGWSSTSLSGTFSVAAGAAKPGTPSNFVFSRTTDANWVVSFTKGSDASSTQLTASKNGAAWYELANPTGTSQTINALTLNTSWRFNAYSKGAGGSSAVVFLGTFYTKPSTPNKPTLAAGKVVNWSNTAQYVHGVEIQRTDNGGTTVSTASLGTVNTWTDPNTQNPLTQYRVRTWAGPSPDQDKTYSDWSAWSDSAMSSTYNKPDVLTFTVIRSDSNGVATEQGTTIRIDATAKVSSVKNASNVETNTVACSFGYQVLQYDANGNPDFTKGTWTSTTVANATIGTWSTANARTGSGNISLGTAYAVRYYIKDAYSPEVVKYLIVPQSKVALSIGKDGIGVGKQLDPAGAALQVAGNAKIEGSLEVSDPNIIIINGVSYQQSGRITNSGLSFSALGSLFRAFSTINMPYTPPSGWEFQVSLQNRPTTNAVAGNTWLSGCSGLDTSTVSAALLSLSSTNPSIVVFGWRLIKS